MLAISVRMSSVDRAATLTGSAPVVVTSLMFPSPSGSAGLMATLTCTGSAPSSAPRPTPTVMSAGTGTVLTSIGVHESTVYSSPRSASEPESFMLLTR